MVAPALRSVGCHYMAYQMQAYVKAKGKYYDGSTTLRMTGNDCKRLEAGIEKFVFSFLRPRETYQSSPSSAKLEQLMIAVNMWSSLARDIRDTRTMEDRVASFPVRAEEFVQHILKSFPNECSDKMFYMHILRDHIGKIMRFWWDTLGWGYG